MGETKATRTRNLRYKRPALASMGYDAIRTELWDIRDACTDIHWFIDQDDDTLLNALDGDEDDAWEFRMAFSDLEAKADRLEQIIGDYYGWGDNSLERTYNDCTVALIGDRYRVLGVGRQIEAERNGIIKNEEKWGRNGTNKKAAQLARKSGKVWAKNVIGCRVWQSMKRGSVSREGIK